MPILQFQGEYRWLSNFASVKVELYGAEFSSTEAAYQAAKARSNETFCSFKKLSAAEAKKKGRTISIRSDWEQVKDSIMEQLLRQKFNQEPYKSLLIDTGNEHIEEGNYWGDTYWGVCKGIGQNRLGKLIMKIREELRNA